MGYAYYDTPLGPAGYGVTDICHEDGCTTAIDRGLAYLCGGTPGSPDEYGCGRWFCAEHSYGRLGDGHGEGTCARCRDEWDAAHCPNCDALLAEGEPHVEGCVHPHQVAAALDAGEQPRVS